MAKPVKLAKGKEFSFAAPKGGGQPSKYPWADWLNGDLLLLEQSAGTKDDKDNVVTVTTKKDFEASVNAMPGKLKFAARKLYKVVEISRFDVDGHRLKDALIIRARAMTADERVAEDQLRAEEKATNVQRREEKKVAAKTAAAAPATASAPANGNGATAPVTHATPHAAPTA